MAVIRKQTWGAKVETKRPWTKSPRSVSSGTKSVHVPLRFNNPEPKLPPVEKTPVSLKTFKSLSNARAEKIERAGKVLIKPLPPPVVKPPAVKPPTMAKPPPVVKPPEPTKRVPAVQPKEEILNEKDMAFGFLAPLIGKVAAPLLTAGAKAVGGAVGNLIKGGSGSTKVEAAKTVLKPIAEELAFKGQVSLAPTVAKNKLLLKSFNEAKTNFLNTGNMAIAKVPTAMSALKTPKANIVSGGVSFGQNQNFVKWGFMILAGLVVVLLLRPFGLFSGK